MMGITKEMLAFGDFNQKERSSLAEAAESSAVSIFTTSSIQEATRWIDSHNTVALLLGTGNGQEELAQETRAQSRYRELPILALSDTPSDLDFVGAYSWGADDVVSASQAWSLTTRLRAFSLAVQGEGPLPRGTAVIAEVDKNRRVATARALYNAGYDVKFALNKEDLEEFSSQEQVALVVVSTDLCPDPLALIQSARSSGSTAKFIIAAAPRRYSELSLACSRSEVARVTDASAPPENVVFLANELCSGVTYNKRVCPRMLYGTSVRFRGEGRDEEEVGFSYNISQDGIYTRTLAPPSDDYVWLELSPPKCSYRVRLVGQVAWRRQFGPHGNATVPPGFGIKIIDMTKRDRDRWLAGWKEASAQLFTSSLLPAGPGSTR